MNSRYFAISNQVGAFTEDRCVQKKRANESYLLLPTAVCEQSSVLAYKLLICAQGFSSITFVQNVPISEENHDRSHVVILAHIRHRAL